MATIIFYRLSLVLSIISFLFVFVAFASPYWYKSWTRVHSPFSNIGLWHVCFAGYIMPDDPVMKSYVGCWWIHSNEFDRVKDHIQPVWFRFIQFFAVIVLFCNLIAMILLCLYLSENLKRRMLGGKRSRMYLIDSVLLLVSAGLVFLTALVFAMKANDGSWMPRPWMNYLSWSYGLWVLSGFCDAFAGMLLFINSLIFADKERRGEQDGIDTAPQGEKDKGGEWLDSREPVQSYPMRSAYPSRPSETSYEYGQQQRRPDDFEGRDARMRRKEKEKESEAASTASGLSGPSVTPSQGSKVNESFV